MELFAATVFALRVPCLKAAHLDLFLIFLKNTFFFAVESCKKLEVFVLKVALLFSGIFAVQQKVENSCFMSARKNYSLKIGYIFKF